MELSPKDTERIKKALIAGAALFAAGATVKYIRDHDGEAKGYLYKLNDGRDWIMGIYRHTERVDLAEVGAGMREKKVEELDTSMLTPGDVDIFEQVIEIARTVPQDG
jgi:hypothetical protein